MPLGIGTSTRGIETGGRILRPVTGEGVGFMTSVWSIETGMRVY